MLSKPLARNPGVELSSLLGGVLNGDTLSSFVPVFGSKLGLSCLLGGFVGIRGFSARLIGGGAFASAMSMLAALLFLCTGIDWSSLLLPPPKVCAGSLAGERLK